MKKSIIYIRLIHEIDMESNNELVNIHHEKLAFWKQFRRYIYIDKEFREIKEYNYTFDGKPLLQKNITYFFFA